MSRAVVTASLLLCLAVAARAPECAAAGLPQGHFVLDGGDVEAAAQPSVRESASLLAAAAEAQEPATQPRPRAFEYSDGYRTRLKIHKYASLATLPLFVAQVAVGQKLYDGNASDGTRSAHSALAVGTGALFAVNTVTGIWNLREGRQDPNHRAKRKIHGFLMMAADVGFVATGVLAPDDEEGGLEGGGGNRSSHRTVAFASMGVATVAYLMMLLGH